MMAWLARRGITPGGVASLTVVGRTSGEPRTVPVTPIAVDGLDYLVAPYGPVSWVHNLRAARVATLQQGRRVQRIEAREVTDAATAARVLQRYVQKTPVVRPVVAAGPEEPLQAFEAIVAEHPVFAYDVSA